MRAWVAPLAMIVLAGCTAGPPGPIVVTEREADTTRGPDEFWMVWVEGEEDRGQTLDACDVAFNHNIDVEARTVRYLGSAMDAAPGDVSALFAFDIFERFSDCPEAYSLHPSFSAIEETAAWGEISLSVSASGVVTGEGATLKPGERATLAAHRNGADITIHIHNLGAWPQSGLHSES